MAEFFGLGDEETEFFLALHLHDRAGSVTLKDHYRKKLDRMRERRREIAARVRGAEPILPHEDLAAYYASWKPSAVHVLATVPEFQDRERLAQRLRMGLAELNQILEFLQRIGLIVLEGSSVTVRESRVHLPAGSPFAGFHHMNWRTRALGSLSAPKREDLHYSGPLSFAREDIRQIRARIIAMLEDVERIVRPSKEETVAALTIDFFEL